jgi:hypothetical protein
LTPPELAELEAEGGPAAVAEHYRQEAEIVFGVNHRKTPEGAPVEQGIGSPGNPGPNHFTVLQMAEGKEVADAARARDAALGQQTTAPVVGKAAVNLKGIQTAKASK